ncbi:LOW QUALITY PROTEIN: hypothetical protein PHMEG_0009387 [Phytophthora megakarya]|uniref:DUF659 domain-containing protein n=1 Tax=Phytophthora megakarya TaxID=4795 RepID=A0A225WGB9_9STRA|nr:LOW QUALITY PROTEIN: hypothetical protein PHMEG_0009387 [Phytophthora megakarya]
MTELALVTDGWSNTNGDGIINFVFVNPKTPAIFWNSMDSKAESHTGRYIADTIWSTILKLEAVIGAGVMTAVVTDNAANMKKRGNYFKQVLEKALTLARFIKHRRGLWSRFRDTQKQLKQQGVKRRRLSLTVATRCYTHENCKTSFKIVTYAGEELDEVTTIFKDESFWKCARIALDLIQPINTSLAAFERDDCSISLVYQHFEWLLRLHEDCCCNVGTEDGLVMEEGRSQFHQVLQEFVLEKEKWRGKHGMTIIDTILSIGGHYHPKAMFSWSIHGFNHTKFRNRLSPDKVSKLVFMYTNIARKSEENHIMYQLFPEECDDSDLAIPVKVKTTFRRRRNVLMSAILQSPVVGEPHQPDENEPDNVFTTPFQQRQSQFTCQTR